MGTLADSFSRLQGHRVYIDTNIFIYFFAQHTVYFSQVAPLIQACASQEILAFTGDLVVAEILMRPQRENDHSLIRKIEKFFSQKDFIRVQPHDRQVISGSPKLATAHRLKLIDAIHFATAIQTGRKFFVTDDLSIKSSKLLEVIHL